MKAVHIIAFILLVIGGLNWLLFAFGWNLVSTIFGAGSSISNAIYILIGLSAVWEAIMHGKNCRTCSTKAM
jgi:uncharacterized protein